MDRRPLTITFFGGLLLLIILVVPSSYAVRPYYKHFDDYLTSLSRKMPGPLADEVEGERSSRKHKNLVIRKLTENGNRNHRHNTSCCMLGELAGDKGFHCYVEYYVARITMRNRNRAHNRKTGFYGRYKVPRYGQRLMKTFEKCVAGHGSVFHKCCHLATLERRERDQYYLARLQSNQSKPPGRRHHNVSTADHNATTTTTPAATFTPTPSVSMEDNSSSSSSSKVSAGKDNSNSSSSKDNETTTSSIITSMAEQHGGSNRNVTAIDPTSGGGSTTTGHSVVTADEIESDDEEIARTLL